MYLTLFTQIIIQLFAKSVLGRFDLSSSHLQRECWTITNQSILYKIL